jgi:hypothetical protein
MIPTQNDERQSNGTTNCTTNGTENKSCEDECRDIGCQKTKEFIRKSINVHGKKYGYSKSIYISAKKDLIIMCPIHGEFEQRPNNHLSGSGCLKCKHDYVSKVLSNSQGDFILSSTKKYGSLYDYGMVKYINEKVPVKISCYRHGVFFMRPYNHLSGQGCPKCGFERRGQLKRSTYSKFVRQATIIHKHKYDYSSVKYNGSHNKVKILCSRHGYFLQTPTHHLSGEGCPKCNLIISHKETSFLDYLKISNKFRQVFVCGKKVDGIDCKNNTIYEFLGDYWHGNPTKYLSSKINPSVHKSFGKLYEETIMRFNILWNAGYSVKYIWESEWDVFISAKQSIPKIIDYNKLRRTQSYDRLNTI